MRIWPVVAVALSLGHAASAQEFHVGVGTEYAKPHSGDDQTSLSLLGGVTVGGPTLRYGVEADANLPILGNDDYNTARLRLVGIYHLGDYDVFGGGGWVRYDFGRDAEDDGTHLMLGVQRNLTDRYSLRGDFTRDFLDDSFTAAVSNTRLSVVFNF